MQSACACACTRGCRSAAGWERTARGVECAQSSVRLGQCPPSHQALLTLHVLPLPSRRQVGRRPVCRLALAAPHPRRTRAACAGRPLPAQPRSGWAALPPHVRGSRILARRSASCFAASEQPQAPSSGSSTRGLCLAASSCLQLLSLPSPVRPNPTHLCLWPAATRRAPTCRSGRSCWQLLASWACCGSEWRAVHATVVW